jgi:hypothetical protein
MNPRSYATGGAKSKEGVMRETEGKGRNIKMREEEREEI